MGRGVPTLGEGAEGGTERAERSGGLHKRSAEDWGSPLRRAIGAEPLPCLYLRVKGRGSKTAPFSLLGAVAFAVVLDFLSGREPGGVQRQSLKLPYAGWLPQERVSSQACLGLRSGVGQRLRPQGAERGSP